MKITKVINSLYDESDMNYIKDKLILRRTAATSLLQVVYLDRRYPTNHLHSRYYIR